MGNATAAPLHRSVKHRPRFAQGTDEGVRPHTICYWENLLLEDLEGNCV